MISNFSEGIALSEKLRLVSFYKLEKKAASGKVIGLEIFLEIEKMFKQIKSNVVINYLGPQSLGDQLKVAISEIESAKIDYSSLGKSVAHINKLI